MVDVYLIICVATGKGYVGITKNGYAKRWHGHLKAAKRPLTKWSGLLVRALAKHGSENFMIIRLAVASSIFEAAALEREFIVWYKTKRPFGLNLTDGGEPFTRSPLSASERQQRSTSQKGRKGKPCPEWLKRYYSKLYKGKPSYVRSPETLRKMSESSRRRGLPPELITAVIASNKRRKGEKRRPYPDGFGKTVSASLKGRKLSEDEVEKVAIRMAKLWQDPVWRQWMRGRQLEGHSRKRALLRDPAAFLG